MSFQPPPPPKTPLAFHRVLSSTASVRVSPLCLGAMNFGESWKAMMGECGRSTVFEILDHFHEAGGNFIDTSNNYQNGESEQWIGEWMEERGVRDQMVIATKFTSFYKAATLGEKDLKSNFTGNNHKSLHLSIEASLKKLKTDYIDILYLHWWDFTTSIEEVMQSLNRFIQAGKVLYLGVSDTPAWIVSKANQYARDHGLKQFCIYQGLWSASSRDLEREILPMCEAEGMAIAPWGALGGGKFKTEEQRSAPGGRAVFGGVGEDDIKVSKVLEKIAKAHGTGLTGVALAYVRHQSPYNVFPVVGGRNVEHLKGNIEALKLTLSIEEIEEIEGAYGFDYGFPRSFLFMGQKASNRLKPGDNFLTKLAMHLDTPPSRAALLEGGK